LAVISTAEYKAYADISGADWDTRLGVLIPIGIGLVENYCGRTFEEATYTDAKFSGTGERSIWIPNTPLTAVSAVKTVDQDGTATTLDSTAYRFTADGQLFRLESSGWGSEYDRPYIYDRPRGPVWSDDAPDNLLITYTGGYSTHPDELKGLMYMVVDALIDEAGENWKLASSGDGAITRAALAPDLITRRFADMCRPWRGSGLAVS